MALASANASLALARRPAFLALGLMAELERVSRLHWVSEFDRVSEVDIGFRNLIGFEDCRV